MQNEKWTPTRLSFYPDGHRRWAKKEYDNGGYDDIETARRDSYVKGAELCCQVIDEFRAMGGKMVDIFLTRPSTYRSEVQSRTDTSLASIHDVIREDLIATLRDCGTHFSAFTRADRPKFSLPAELKSKEEIRSWHDLVDDVKNDEQEVDSNEFTANLLINYDGALEVRVRQRVLELLSKDPHALTQAQIQNLDKRLLPVYPSADMLLRTCPPEDTNGFRMSSGPVSALAETNFVIINKPSPDVTDFDIKSAFDRVVDFRTKKLHIPESLSKEWF